MMDDLPDALDDAFERDELASFLAPVERRIASRRRRRRAAAVAAAAALPIVGLLAWWFTGRSPDLPAPEAPAPHAEADAPVPALTLDEGAPLTSPLQREGGIALSDGSRLQLGPATELVPVTHSDDEIAFELVRGRVRFDVEPGGPRRWEITAGPLHIEVLGTAFTVTRNGDAATVRVHRGVVDVIARGERHRLTAGQHLGVAPPEPPAPSPVTAPRSPPAPPSVDTLLGRADAYRRAGALDEATRALEDIVELHPDAPEAATAALSWGQLEEDRGHPTRALRIYRRALALTALPALEELCYLRMIRVQLATGDRAGAEATRRAHESSHPDGAQAAAIEALLRR